MSDAKAPEAAGLDRPDGWRRNVLREIVLGIEHARTQGRGIKRLRLDAQNYGEIETELAKTAQYVPAGEMLTPPPAEPYMLVLGVRVELDPNAGPFVQVDWNEP